MKGLVPGLVLLVGCALAGAQDVAPPSAPVTPPRVARLSGGVMAGQILTKVAPVYPEEAKQAHLQGVVVLHAVIGRDGTIRSLTAVSGNEMLRKAALEAVGQWTYRPYLLNGQPTQVDTTITVNFTLADTVVGAPGVAPVPPEPGSVSRVIEVWPPGAPPAGGVRVSAQVAAANLVTKVAPTYPPDAKAARIQGPVVLRVRIAKDGTVEKAAVVDGAAELRDSALEAVRQWVYKPYLVDGVPVGVDTMVVVNFTLGG